MSTKKVLIVLPNDQLDGAEQVLYQISCFYAKLGYDVDVFFLKLQKYGGWDNIPAGITLYYTSVNKERFGILQLIKNLNKYAFGKQYLFAYTSHTQITGIIGILRRLHFLKIKYFIGRESTSIFVRFSGWKLLFFKACYQLGFRQTNLLICQTSFMKQQLFEGMPKLFHSVKQIAVIPNPIVYEHIVQLQGLTRPYSRDYLVAAGRFIPEKGYDILIHSFNKIAQDYPDLDLLILGKGNEKINLQTQIKAMNLTHRVMLVGHVKDVYSYFKFAEACVVSSRCEGFPNVLLQMMSQNKRVVSTLCAGDIEQLKGVFVCQPHDSLALAHAITDCLQSSVENNVVLFDEELRGRDIRLFIEKVHVLVDHDLRDT